MRTFIIIILIPIFCTKSGQALLCWECNSRQVHTCGDPFHAENFESHLDEYLIDCPGNSVCKKVKTFDTSGVFVDRLCHSERRYCDGITRELNNVKQICTYCSTTGCNFSLMLSVSFISILIPVISTFLCAYF